MEQLIVDFLKSIGISAYGIRYTKRSKSCFCVGGEKSHRIVPYLKLFVYEISYEDVIHEHRNLGLAKEEIADRVRDFVSKITMGMEEREEYYDPAMYVGVNSWERQCYGDFVYNHKDMIERVVFSIVGIFPHRVYASSTPSVNIIFQSFDYNRRSIGKYKSQIESEVKLKADKFVEEKYGTGLSKDVFEVNLWNPDMEGYNGYGLARQD